MKKLLLILVVLSLYIFPGTAQQSGGAPVSGGAVSGGGIPSGGAPIPEPVDTNPTMRTTPLVEALPSGSYDVARIIDADTLVVSDPSEPYVYRSVRVLGIDGKERGDPSFDTARAHAQLLLEGATVTLSVGTPGVDIYGRALAAVTLPGGSDYALSMLASGWVDVLRSDDLIYKAARDGAKSVGKGLWQGATFKDYNCPAFRSRAEAQAFYQGAYKSERPDPSRLDPDKDGLACESLRR